MAMRKQPDFGALFTIAQVAEKAQVSAKTIRRAIKETGPKALGYITIRDQIRIPEAFYLDWLRRNSCEPRL